MGSKKKNAPRLYFIVPLISCLQVLDLHMLANLSNLVSCPSTIDIIQVQRRIKCNLKFADLSVLCTLRLWPGGVPRSWIWKR